jgi:hypothetical protein
LFHDGVGARAKRTFDFRVDYPRGSYPGQVVASAFPQSPR